MSGVQSESIRPRLRSEALFSVCQGAWNAMYRDFEREIISMVRSESDHIYLISVLNDGLTKATFPAGMALAPVGCHVVRFDIPATVANTYDRDESTACMTICIKLQNPNRELTCQATRENHTTAMDLRKVHNHQRTLRDAWPKLNGVVVRTTTVEAQHILSRKFRLMTATKKACVWVFRL